MEIRVAGIPFLLFWSVLALTHILDEIFTTAYYRYVLLWRLVKMARKRSVLESECEPLLWLEWSFGWWIVFSSC